MMGYVQEQQQQELAAKAEDQAAEEEARDVDIEAAFGIELGGETDDDSDGGGTSGPIQTRNTSEITPVSAIRSGLQEPKQEERQLSKKVIFLLSHYFMAFRTTMVFGAHFFNFQVIRAMCHHSSALAYFAYIIWQHYLISMKPCFFRHCDPWT
jgi:hypothetical protein